MIDIDLSGNWADELLESMQGPKQREAMKAAFHATPEELGKAAVEYAKYCNGCKFGSHCLSPDCGCGCR